jgi:hypothetical protein
MLFGFITNFFRYIEENDTRLFREFSEYILQYIVVVIINDLKLLKIFH